MDSQDKNKKILFSIIGIALLAVIIGLFLHHNSDRAKNAPNYQALPPILWRTFEGTNPSFNFTFECPGTWKTKELKLTEALNMVQVLGPKDEEAKFIPAIYIKIKDTKGGNLSSKFSETLLKREGKFRGFKKLHEGSGVVSGVKGSRLGYQYILPLPMRSTHAKDTVVRREEVLVEKDGKSYQISFWATGKQFEAGRIIFEHLLKTFKFKA